MSASLGAQSIRLDQIKEPAFVWDPDRARIVDANAGAISLWQEPSVADLLEREFDPHTAFNDLLAREALGEGSQSVERELPLPFPSGERLQRCHVTYRALSDSRRGFLIAILGEAERGTAESHARLAHTAFEAPAALLAVDTSGTILAENPAAIELFGTGRESDLGHRLGSDKDARAIVEAALLNGRAGGTRKVQTRVGARRVRLTARRSEDPITQRPLIIIYAADIEDQRTREAGLRAENEILHEFLEAGTDFMLELDLDLRVSFVSGTILSHLEVDAPTLLGLHWRDLTARFHLVSANEIDFAFNARSGWRDSAITIERKDSVTRHLTSARTIQSDRGDFRGYRIVGREVPADAAMADLTQLHAAPLAPSAANEFAEILNAAPWAVVIQRRFTPLYINTAFAEMFGFPLDAKDTPQDITLLHLFPQTERTLSDDYDKLLSGEVSFAARDIEAVRADGRPLSAQLRARAIDWQGEGAVEYVIEDTSAQQREKRNGEQRAAVLSALVDAVPEGVFLLDGGGEVEWANIAAMGLLGLETDDAPPRDVADIFSPEDIAWVKDYITGLVDGGLTRLFQEGREVTILRANGERLPVLLALDRIDAGGPVRVCAVIRDLTAWKRTEEELREARATAENESTRKTEFLARVSHELRTPLTAILGFAEIMAKEQLGPVGTPKYIEYAQDILTSGDHLLSLINDLLDMSKVEAGKLNLSFESVNLVQVASNCVQLMSTVARGRQIRLYADFPDQMPEVVADERSIRQVLLNLISNALRFTEPGGEVILTAEMDAGGGLTLLIRDTGVGMSVAELQVALEPFEQVQKKVAGGTPGTGLGLPLAKALTEANRAYFQVQSQPAMGTSVAITFPSTQVLA